MPVIQLIIILAVIGLLLWLVNTYIPMSDPIKKILNIVVLIAVILWLLNVFGLLGGMSSMRVGHGMIVMLPFHKIKTWWKRIF